MLASASDGCTRWKASGSDRSGGGFRRLVGFGTLISIRSVSSAFGLCSWWSTQQGMSSKCLGLQHTPQRRRHRHVDQTASYWHQVQAKALAHSKQIAVSGLGCVLAFSCSYPGVQRIMSGQCRLHIWAGGDDPRNEKRAVLRERKCWSVESWSPKVTKDHQQASYRYPLQQSSCRRVGCFESALRHGTNERRESSSPPSCSTRTSPVGAAVSLVSGKEMQAKEEL